MKLQTYIASWNGFDWESSNCAHFAAQWAGVDLSNVVMPSGKEGVRAALRSIDASSIMDAVSSRLGEPIHPSLAKAGDIVLAGHTLGICNGRLFAAPKDGNGVVFVPMEQAEAAWRV